MDYTKILAEYAAGIRYDNLPTEVVEKAKFCILDFFANVYGSQQLDAVKRINKYIRSLGGPDVATALACGFKTGIHHAAFLNGTAAEAIESQDGLRFGGNHPGVAVIPAALAIAQQHGRGGKEVIAAIVAGYEVAGRIAASVHPQHTLSGFLPTGTCGAFGAAAAASLLLKQDVDGMINSLGNAGYVLPLSMAETLMGGFTSKIVQGGQAAGAGITAAGMAGVGITGAPYVLEGSHLNGGFAKITSGSMEPNLDKIVEGLGKSYSIMDIYFKPYTACRHTHGCAQAALELVKTEGVTPANIESIDAYTYGIAAIATGKPVDENSSFVSAQFSIPYVVGACLVDGEMGPTQMTEERIADPALLAMAGKVNIHMDQNLNDAYPEHTSSRLEIKLTNAKVVTHQVDDPIGDPRFPMGADDLRAKMISFAKDRDPASVNAIVDDVLNLEKIENIRQSPMMA
jgi:2-methylcitrate dehydratase PrpD